MFCACGTIICIPGRQTSGACRTCKQKVHMSVEEITFDKRYASEEMRVCSEVKAPRIKQTCPACGAGEMYYNAIQTRSADEGQTVFYSCDCGHRMKLDS